MIRRPEDGAYRTAEAIVRRLQRHGHRALLAGGCVRDLLLGARPKDYDVATSATPQQVQQLFPRTEPVGAQFGVVLVIEDGHGFQVATFRTESGYADGRHPGSVAFADLAADAQRRDFTINAMYWDPVSGELVDLVGGQRDLDGRLVRAIGDPEQRFREDHLRILRAVRFAARLGFRIERTTSLAMQKLAPLAGNVSAERLQQELRIILTDREPALALRIMDELGILAHILPEVEQTKGCEQPPNYHPEGDVFVHTLLTVEKLGPHPEFELAMAALLHDVGKPEASRRAGPMRFPEHERIGEEMARQICRRLRLPKAQTDRICWLVKRHMYLRHVREMRDSTLKRLFAEPGFEQLCALYRADALASWGRLDDLHYALERRRSMTQQELNPPRLISGHDLIELGYEPGPAFGTILRRVREMQLDGRLSTREEALRQAGHIAESIGAPRLDGAGKSRTEQS